MSSVTIGTMTLNVVGPPIREVDVFLEWFNHVWKRPPNELEAELNAPTPDRARVEELGALLRSRLELFDRLLDQRDYLFGDKPGVADFAAFPFLKYALALDPTDEDRFHRILHEHLELRADHMRLAAWIRRVDGFPRA